MKVYGYTHISSEDIGDGTLSETRIFIDRKERNNAFYKQYARERFFLREKGYSTDNRSIDELIKDFDRVGGHLRLVYGDEFVQFEAFEENL